MPFEVVSGVGRWIGVLDGGGDRHCNHWGLCGVVILCRERLRRGSSQITLGFLVSINYT